MSRLPGLRLEDFLAWNYDVVVLDEADPNWSLMAAEALGTIKPRDRMRRDEFGLLVAVFEPYREDVERRLATFDGEAMSWRDYAGAAFDFIPEAAFDHGGEVLASLRKAGERHG